MRSGDVLSGVFQDYDWADEGLTRHKNWWPALYGAACRSWGLEPDPKVLACATAYETSRADLKTVPAAE